MDTAAIVERVGGLASRTLAMSAQPFDLRVVQRIDVGKSLAQRSREDRVVSQQFAAGNDFQRRQCACVFPCNAFENPFAQCLARDKVRVAGPDFQVCLGQHHLHVRQHRREKGPVDRHVLQELHARLAAGGRAGRADFDELKQRGAHAEPAGKHEPALCPREAPWDRAKILNALPALACGRPRADIQARDFRDRRRCKKVFGKSRCLVDEVAVGGLRTPLIRAEPSG